ncbi:MAG TPA: tetratricopeptide repeat protein [Terriglobia bacterium]|nr:tetratricopeptide repeat protein [Terriglobia bacterium]
MNGKRRLPLSMALLVVSAGLFVGKVPSAAAEDSAGQADTASGSIAGTVKSPSGVVVAGARVTLLGEADAARPTGLAGPTGTTVVTDARGNFSFAAIPAGTYTLEVESAGFPKSSRSNVVVAGRSRVVADFTLVPGNASDGFNYDDSAQFKPSAVNAAVDPGGYSAAKEVDSYSLMLDYVHSEATFSDHALPPTQAVNGQAQAQINSPVPPTAAELDSWNESQFLSHGSDLLLHHDLAASIESFQAGVVRFPNSARLATGLGIAFSARGEYEKAMASLLHATDLAPSDPRPYLVLAKAYVGSPAPNQEVPKRLARLVKLDPKNPLAPYYYALVLAKGGPGAEAAGDDAPSEQIESLLKSALALDPNFADAHLQLGILYASRSNYPDAIREYQSAVRLKPSLATAHYRLAQAYSRTGDKAAARHELDLYQHLRQQAPAGSAGVSAAHH